MYFGLLHQTLVVLAKILIWEYWNFLPTLLAFKFSASDFETFDFLEIEISNYSTGRLIQFLYKYVDKNQKQGVEYDFQVSGWEDKTEPIKPVVHIFGTDKNIDVFLQRRRCVWVWLIPLLMLSSNLPAHLDSGYDAF